MAELDCEITLTGNVTGVPQICFTPTVEDLREHADLKRFTVNSYTCPVGQASGRAWLFMRRGDLDLLTTPNEAGATDSEYTLSMKALWPDKDEEAKLPELLIVKAVRLNIGEPDDPDSPYIVELADKRIILEQWADSGVILANIRSHANPTDYLTGTTGAGSSMTWNELVELVWNTMDHVLGTYSETVTSDAVPEGWDIRGENAWSILHSILRKLGKTVAYDPTDASYSIVDVAPESQSIPGSYAADLLRDAEPIEHDATRFPETIRVYFRSHYESYGQERDTELGTNWQVEDNKASTSRDVATNISGAIAGTVLPLWDDLPEVFDEDNAINNAAALTTRANAIASAWIDDASIDRAFRHYAGFKTEVLPGGTIKSIRWENTGRGPITVITQRHGSPAAAPKGNGSAGLSDLSSSAEELRSPDLSRSTYPNFPRLPNIVVVDDGTTADGHAIAANASGLFPGKVQRWVAGVLTELETCWIRPVDLEFAVSPSEGTVISLRQRDKFVGRLSGIETDGFDTRPIYLIRSGSGDAERSPKVFFGTCQVLGGGASVPTSAWDHVSPGVGGWDKCVVTPDPVDPTSASSLLILLPHVAFGGSGDGLAPNLAPGALITYTYPALGNATIVSDYTDAAIGDIDIWDGAESTIRFGWKRHTPMNGFLPVGVDETIDGNPVTEPDISSVGVTDAGSFSHEHSEQGNSDGKLQHTGGTAPGLGHNNQGHTESPLTHTGSSPGLTHSNQTHTDVAVGAPGLAHSAAEHTLTHGVDASKDHFAPDTSGTGEGYFDHSGSSTGHTGIDDHLIDPHVMSDAGQDHTIDNHTLAAHTPGDHTVADHDVSVENHWNPLYPVFFKIRFHE